MPFISWLGLFFEASHLTRSWLYVVGCLLKEGKVVFCSSNPRSLGLTSESRFFCHRRLLRSCLKSVNPSAMTEKLVDSTVNFSLRKFNNYNSVAIKPRKAMYIAGIKILKHVNFELRHHFIEFDYNYSRTLPTVTSTIFIGTLATMDLFKSNESKPNKRDSRQVGQTLRIFNNIRCWAVSSKLFMNQALVSSEVLTNSNAMTGHCLVSL